MKINLKQTFLLCGLAVMLAAFPVFGQENAEPEIRLNKKPLEDLADFVTQRIKEKELNLSNNFLVEVEGELKKDGKFDEKTTKYVRTEGDEKMIDVAKNGLEALNDSGFLRYLSDLGTKKTNIILSQNDEQMYAIIKTDFESQERARSVQSAFRLIINVLKAKKNQQNVSQNDKDDLVLLEGALVESKDKTVIIKFVVDKPIAQEMIQRRLADKINRQRNNK